MHYKRSRPATAAGRSICDSISSSFALPFCKQFVYVHGLQFGVAISPPKTVFSLLPVALDFVAPAVRIHLRNSIRRLPTSISLGSGGLTSVPVWLLEQGTFCLHGCRRQKSQVDATRTFRPAHTARGCRRGDRPVCQKRLSLLLLNKNTLLSDSRRK
jgi:hypothetical protein